MTPQTRSEIPPSGRPLSRSANGGTAHAFMDVLYRALDGTGCNAQHATQLGSATRRHRRPDDPLAQNICARPVRGGPNTTGVAQPDRSWANRRGVAPSICDGSHSSGLVLRRARRLSPRRLRGHIESECQPSPTSAARWAGATAGTFAFGSGECVVSSSPRRLNQPTASLCDG